MEAQLELGNENSVHLKLLRLRTQIEKGRINDAFESIYCLSLEELNQYSAQDPTNGTLLHLAAFHGQEHIVKRLLARGLSPLATDHRGYMPVHYAVLKNDTNLIQLFTGRNFQECLLPAQNFRAAITNVNWMLAHASALHFPPTFQPMLGFHLQQGKLAFKRIAALASDAYQNDEGSKQVVDPISQLAEMYYYQSRDMHQERRIQQEQTEAIEKTLNPNKW